MDFNQIALLVGGIVVICEAVKRAGLKTKYIPLLSVVLGLAGALWLGGADFLSAASGVLVGLATTLGYREVKNSLVE